jgi:hypothetical protein
MVAGTYMIAYHTDSKAVAGGTPATCQGEGASVTDPPFLLLTVDNLGSLNWGQCTSSTDPTSCTSEFYSFDDIGGTWKIGAATSASYSGGSCTLFHAEGSVTVVTPNPLRVRLETKEWNTYMSGAESACTTDAAAALASQDACNEHVVIEATPI